MKTHLIDTNLMIPRSRSSFEVKYLGQIFKEMVAVEAFMFHKRIFFFPQLSERFQKCSAANCQIILRRWKHLKLLQIIIPTLLCVDAEGRFPW